METSPSIVLSLVLASSKERKGWHEKFQNQKTKKPYKKYISIEPLAVCVFIGQTNLKCIGKSFGFPPTPASYCEGKKSILWKLISYLSVFLARLCLNEI